MAMAGVSIAAVVESSRVRGGSLVGSLAMASYDALHGNILENSGVQAWWPAFCLAYGLGAAGGLAWRIKRGR